MNDTLITLFFAIDDFCKEFCPKWEKMLLTQRIKKRCRFSRIAPSEIMTLFIYFHILRIVYLVAWLKNQNQPWDGFLALNYISSFMTEES